MQRFSLADCCRLAFMALSLGACTSEIPDEGLSEGGTPITFRTSEMTKAVKEDFVDGDAFSVWGGYDGDATGVFDGERVTNFSGQWDYSGGNRYWVFGKEYDFHAVYPSGTGDCDSNGNLTISYDYQTKQDLMTAEHLGISYVQRQTPRPVSFSFRHELTRVSIVVNVDPGITVTDLEATLSGFHGSGTLTRTSPSDATWSLEGDTQQATCSAPSVGTTQSLFDDLLLIPQSTNAIRLSLSLLHNGSPVTHTADFAGNPGQWEAGQAYRYVLHIRVDAITFGGFTVDEWDTTESDGNINIQ